MTTPRIYKKVPYTPEQALAIMLKEKTVHFDSVLPKIFIGLVGIFPIGSLVLLNTRETGIVYKPSHDPKWLDRPIVILVARDGKGEVKKEVVDLTETDGGGRYKRSIVKTLDLLNTTSTSPSISYESGKEVFTRVKRYNSFPLST